MSTQPTPSVSDEDVERVANREFPAGQMAEVRAILAEYGGEDWHREAARVRLAALKLAGGKIDRLKSAIETANQDYRDVLASAEYPAYSRLVDPSRPPNPDECQRIVDADWKQYRDWLRR